MEIVQLPPGLTEAPQVLPVLEKMPWLAPAIVTAVRFSGIAPGFVRVRVCAGLVVPTVVLRKDRLEGENTACGVGAMVAVPANVAVWGEPTASSATLTAAVRLPLVVG